MSRFSLALLAALSMVVHFASGNGGNKIYVVPLP